MTAEQQGLNLPNIKGIERKRTASVGKKAQQNDEYGKYQKVMSNADWDDEMELVPVQVNISKMI